jgi:hypothetical protein
MARNVNIKKTVYDKSNFNKIVDREFKTYAQPAPPSTERTVEQFFDEYEKLFYEIPVEGDSKSHKYLITKSSELVDFEKDTQDIQPLLDEIAQLREQILTYQQQLIEANKPDINIETYTL